MAKYTWPKMPDQQGDILQSDAMDALHYSMHTERWKFTGESRLLTLAEIEAMLDKEIDLFYRRFPVSPTLVLVPQGWLHLLEGSLNLHIQVSPESITYRYREIPLQTHDQPFGVVVIGPVQP